MILIARTSVSGIVKNSFKGGLHLGVKKKSKIPVKTENGITTGSHGLLKKDKNKGQSHHLNQNAAYKNVIPTENAIAVKAKGNAFKDIDSEHYNAHESLEKFWNSHRKDNTRPTNLEYTKALKKSLEDAGYDKLEVKELTKKAIRDRIKYGQLGGNFVPRVPGRLPQKPRGN